jgi:UDP:flavonoid glycosyltransferase YjiC (YdhE family)
MRVLFTTQQAPSHLRAIVPIAQAVQRQGHDTAVAAPPCLYQEIAEYLLTPLPAGTDLPKDLRSQSSMRQSGSVLPDFESGFLRMFAGERVLNTARDILHLAQRWRPDLIVRDVAELGGCLAAEVLAIPHASIASVGGIGGQVRISRDSTIAGLIDSHRKALGLGADPEMRALFRFLHVNLMPAEYDPTAMQLPNARCYRQTNPERIGEALPTWLHELPSERPVVFASFDTRFPNLPGRLEFILSALAKLECFAIVAIGAGKDAASFGQVPDHVRLVDHIAQPLVLQCCDLFITHGGFNGIRESLRLGVPMVVSPVIGDQPHNARCCTELGVAVTVPPSETSSNVLADACRQVLAKPGFRRCARAMQRQILALPSLDHLVLDLEGLARSRLPALSGFA